MGQGGADGASQHSTASGRCRKDAGGEDGSEVFEGHQVDGYYKGLKSTTGR